MKVVYILSYSLYTVLKFFRGPLLNKMRVPEFRNILIMFRYYSIEFLTKNLMYEMEFQIFLIHIILLYIINVIIKSENWLDTFSLNATKVECVYTMPIYLVLAIRISFIHQHKSLCWRKSFCKFTLGNYRLFGTKNRTWIKH